MIDLDIEKRELAREENKKKNEEGNTVGPAISVPPGECCGSGSVEKSRHLPKINKADEV